MEEPLLITCFPRTCASVVFGRAQYSRMIRRANAFVLTCRSRLASSASFSFIIPHSSFLCALGADGGPDDGGHVAGRNHLEGAALQRTHLDHVMQVLV